MSLLPLRGQAQEMSAQQSEAQPTVSWGDWQQWGMTADGKGIDRSSARLVNEGWGREANKLIYHEGYYYLVFSEHRDGIGRYVMAKRDRTMTGAFSEERIGIYNYNNESDTGYIDVDYLYYKLNK